MGPATAALRLVGSAKRFDERRVTAMAERKRMTAEQVVGYLLEGEGLDYLRESLAWVATADGGGGQRVDRGRSW